MTTLVSIAVIGRKGAGRSGVLRFLIGFLKKAGCRAGVIKHLAREDMEIEQPGKDTYEYRRQGAKKVILSGRKKYALFADIEEEIPLPELLKEFWGFDIVFLEGYLLPDVPLIEIHRKEKGGLMASKFRNLIAVCSDDNPTGLETSHAVFFSWDEMESLGGFLLATVHAAKRGERIYAR